MRKPNKNKMAGINSHFASVSESIFNGFLLKILLRSLSVYILKQLKGCGQERPLDFSLKSKMAKTAPNFACQFVYTCRKLPYTYFPSFLLRIPEIKYAKKHLHVMVRFFWNCFATRYY